MSNKNKFILSCLPFVLVAVLALLVPVLKERREARTLDRLETAPLETGVTVSNGVVTLGRRVYSVGGYGVAEIGHMRLVFQDWPFEGKSAGQLSYREGSSSATSQRGSTGDGKRTFQYEGIPGGNRCGFGGISFDIVDGKFIRDGRTIDVTGQPVLVMIGGDKTVREVKPLKAPAP